MGRPGGNSSRLRGVGVSSSALLIVVTSRRTGSLCAVRLVSARGHRDRAPTPGSPAKLDRDVLDGPNLDPLVTKGLNDVGRCAVVGDDEVDVLAFTNSRKCVLSKFGTVRNDDGRR